MISLSEAKWKVKIYPISYRRVWVWEAYLNTADYKITAYCDSPGFKTEKKALDNWKLFARVNGIKNLEVKK